MASAEDGAAGEVKVGRRPSASPAPPHPLPNTTSTPCLARRRPFECPAVEKQPVVVVLGGGGSPGGRDRWPSAMAPLVGSPSHPVITSIIVYTCTCKAKFLLVLTVHSDRTSGILAMALNLLFTATFNVSADENYDDFITGIRNKVANPRHFSRKNVRVTVTGHSLGGTLAQMAAHDITLTLLINLAVGVLSASPRRHLQELAPHSPPLLPPPLGAAVPSPLAPCLCRLAPAAAV
uniref:Fungal lipase-type domain-containing protein n=1 Tax=Oryza meridionalis TaxID=40149 RepID=A0A0E0CI89_9ORYZ